jgi:hypothetical protein
MYTDTDDGVDGSSSSSSSSSMRGRGGGNNPKRKYTELKLMTDARKPPMAEYGLGLRWVFNDDGRATEGSGGGASWASPYRPVLGALDRSRQKVAADNNATGFLIVPMARTFSPLLNFDEDDDTEDKK